MNYSRLPKIANHGFIVASTHLKSINSNQNETNCARIVRTQQIPHQGDTQFLEYAISIIFMWAYKLNVCNVTKSIHFSETHKLTTFGLQPRV